ncbi:plakophilin-3-like isoform X2 [Scleropages formosus]|uniref:Plakophilin 3 n=1 Tax=Scleropages formosus TaxID=113540 RepID=A0A8C9T793_SCLFO|nr:plakophilin-3 isoform X2 [Scleropages formosus]
MPESSVSSYALPSGVQLERGGSASDPGAATRRVQQQVQMRLTKTSRVTQQVNGSADYGISPSVKYSTYNPAFSSKSHMMTGSHTIPAPKISQFSSHSLVDTGSWRGGGSSFYQSTRQQVESSGVGRVGTLTGTLSQGTVRQAPKTQQRMSSYVDQDFAYNGPVLDRSVSQQRHTLYGDSSFGQLGTTGSINRGLGGVGPGGGAIGAGAEAELSYRNSFEGPAHRTLTRMSRTPRASIYSVQGQQMSGTSQGVTVQQQTGGGSLLRSSSVKSVVSLAKGADIMDGQMEAGGSMGKFTGINQLDMRTAVAQLSSSDPELQVQGAAFIQHECYHKAEAKTQVAQLKGIPALVQLFNCGNTEVQRYATGAMRNVIYENIENKTLLLQAGGISQLIEALKEPDNDLRKNITGILWNLSSKDNLKEKLAQDALPQLTEKILVPLASGGDSEAIQQSPSEADIFCNTTGCLRNLSSMNEKIRQKMRDMHGLVNSLVGYIQKSIQDGTMEGQGVENSVCILRNLSYQLYSEMPPSVLARLEGPSRGQDYTRSDGIGCFAPQSKKAKDKLNPDLFTLSEVAKQPKGQEWLWHPQVVGLFKRVLQSCESNMTTTREAAAGALNNITAGDYRWASVLSHVALEQEHILPVLLDQLRTSSDQELRSVTGLLRNLSRHARNKDNMAAKVVNPLITRLPSDGHQKEPSSEVVVSICSILNNLVTVSLSAARDITNFDGLQKLMAIKDNHDSSPGKLKAAKAAATVLTNMFQYKKLHANYSQKGFTRKSFNEISI